MARSVYIRRRQTSPDVSPLLSFLSPLLILSIYSFSLSLSLCSSSFPYTFHPHNQSNGSWKDFHQRRDLCENVMERKSRPKCKKRKSWPLLYTYEGGGALYMLATPKFCFHSFCGERAQFLECCYRPQKRTKWGREAYETVEEEEKKKKEGHGKKKHRLSGLFSVIGHFLPSGLSLLGNGYIFKNTTDNSFSRTSF